MDESAEGGNVERELRARVAVDDEADLDPEWPSPSPPVRPPLRRRSQGKWVAGVAGGLSDHWGVPAIVLRIPLAIAALVTAVALWNTTADISLLDSSGLPGLILVASLAATATYGVLWVILPREDVVRSPARRFSERYPGIRSIPGVVVLAIGGAILADRLGIWQPDLVLAAALIALGLWLFRRDRVDPSEPRSAERAPQGEVTVQAAAAPSPAPAIVRPPRERSPLGWITFGVALLVVCVAAIWTSLAADTLSTLHRAVGLTRISTIPAVGLLVLATGLVIGSVFGRARWLILPALLVVPVVLIASVVRLPFEGAFGNSYLRARDLAEQEVATQRKALGSVYVDLSRFQGRPEVERELHLSAVLGTVSIVVPFDAHVRIDAFTGLGTIGLGRRSTYGLEVSDSATLEPRHGDGATFTVQVEVGLGDVHVYRYSPTKRELHQLRREARLAERQERNAEREAAA